MTIVSGETMNDPHIFTDTRLAQEFEQFQFSQCSQAKHGMIEGCDLFDGNLTATRLVYGRAHDTVCTLAYYIKYLVLGAYATTIQ